MAGLAGAHDRGLAWAHAALQACEGRVTPDHQLRRVASTCVALWTCAGGDTEKACTVLSELPSGTDQDHEVWTDLDPERYTTFLRRKRYGNFSDAFLGVSEENKVQLEMAAKEDGRAALFHNKAWAVDIYRCEVCRRSRRVWFTAWTGERFEFGIRISEVVANIDGLGDHLLVLIRMNDQTGEAIDAHYVPLVVIDSGPS